MPQLGRNPRLSDGYGTDCGGGFLGDAQLRVRSTGRPDSGRHVNRTGSIGHQLP
jgi:hypothetical protein